MMALLPGIDANDEHKAQSVFRFYVVAFSSVPVIEVRLGLTPVKVVIGCTPLTLQEMQLWSMEQHCPVSFVSLCWLGHGLIRNCHAFF